jgi:hypothetical protein
MKQKGGFGNTYSHTNPARDWLFGINPFPERFEMNVKLRFKFKNGCSVAMLYNIGDPPKGTPPDAHYLLESVSLVEKIQHNGVCLQISPENIGSIFVQPPEELRQAHKEMSYGSTRNSRQIRQAL